MMCQMFSMGERSGLQAGQFSTWTLLLRSHAVVIAAVCGFALSCWNTQGLPWNRRRLEGSICCSKTFIYFSAFIVPSKTCKLPIPYALMHHQRYWLLNWTLITRWKSPSSLAWRTRRLWFPTRMLNLDSSDHRTSLFLVPHIIHEYWACQICFSSLSSYAFMFLLFSALLHRLTVLVLSFYTNKYTVGS